MATDPWAQGVLLDVAWRLVVALVCGIAVEWAIRRAVRRPTEALVRRSPGGTSVTEEVDGEARAEHGETEPPWRRRLAAITMLRRLPLVFMRFVLELLPVIGFALTSHLIVGTTLGGDNLIRLVLLAVIDAYALCIAVFAVARTVFSPTQPRLRLMHVSNAMADYALLWIRRITVVSVCGYAIAEAGLLLGLSDSAHEALLKGVGLVDHLFVAIIVLQQRRAVKRWLRAPAGATGALAAVRNQLARIWHWIAIAFLAALWLVWAIEIPEGYSRMMRFFIVTALVLIGARLAQIVALGLIDRAFRIAPDAMSNYPGMEVRLHRYRPALCSAMRAAIVACGLVVLLQLWGLGALDWLMASELGQRVIAALVMLGVTVLLALLVWESVNAAIEHHLAKLARDSQLARSARLRTLLPLLRSTLLIVILIVAGLMVLSEIGLNIGPLLAGAGIVGVAIGFGSQKLVQDLITGIFLLLENAMQVGDWVTVSGLSGTVENLSVRTIRLRAADGSVHIIPFSAVTSVTNVNRGLGNASVSVTVSYGEDTDRVSQLLRDIVTEMRGDKDFSAKMLSDLQLWGVDKVDGACVTILGQVVCTDSGRWSVQREFNRRMKRRFQELGIEIFNPMRTIALMPKSEPPQEQPS
jgi:small-conductance mechanosensitive channel